MTAERRRVRRGGFFLQTAEHHFPIGGSADGRPSFERFEAGPLKAIEELFGRAFDELPEPYPGIRAWTTIEVPVFGPMTFYGLLVDDYVELIDLVVDEDYEWGSPADPGADDGPA